MLWKISILSSCLLAAAVLLVSGSTKQAQAGCCSGHAEHLTSATAIAADERAALSDSDKEAIKKQKICPVSGQALGSMGDPIKVTAKGRSIFLCCSGCVKSFKLTRRSTSRSSTSRKTRRSRRFVRGLGGAAADAVLPGSDP